MNCMEVNYCYLNLCQYDGVCMLLINVFVCFCLIEWIGYLCEKCNYCSISFCWNDGICINGIVLYSCNCIDNWIDRDCV